MKNLILLFAAVALVVSVGCSRKEMTPAKKAAARTKNVHERVGTELAEAIQEDLKGKPRILVIRSSDTASFAQDEALTFAALLKALDGEAVEARMPDQKLSAEAKAAGAPIVPQPLTASWLAKELAQRGGKVDAVVSLIGEIEDGEKAKDLPPIYCFAPVAQPPRLVAQMEKGVLKMAVAQRLAGAEASEKDWFNIRYALVRPDNAKAWAEGR